MSGWNEETVEEVSLKGILVCSASSKRPIERRVMSGGSFIKTIGIWLGSPIKIPMQREGITRYLVSLAKSLVDNFDVEIEVWAYEFNRKEVQNSFAGLNWEGSLNRKLRIVTEVEFCSTAERRLYYFKECVSLAYQMMGKGKKIGWQVPFEIYKASAKAARIGMQGTKFGRLQSFLQDLLFSLLLLMGGGFFKSMDKVRVRYRGGGAVVKCIADIGWFFVRIFQIHKSVMQTGSDMSGRSADLLATLANEFSRAQLFIVPNVTLSNAIQLKHKKLVAIHDLVVFEFLEEFVRLDPTYRFQIEEVKQTLKEFAGGGAFFVSNCNYVRENHLLKHFPEIERKRSAFVYVPVIVPENERITTPTKTQLFRELKLEREYLFYPSQIRPYKNVTVLLRALKLLKEKGTEIDLVLTGQYRYYEELVKFIRNHHLRKSVLVRQNLSESQLYALHRHAAATVVPSLFEGGLPWQIMEALLMGAPAIMARIPVTLERLKSEGIDLHEPGLMLFDPDDANELVEKITEAINDREGVVLKQRVIREKLLRRTWKDLGDEYFMIFANLLAENDASITPGQRSTFDWKIHQPLQPGGRVSK